jgi:hypothetical protein
MPTTDENWSAKIVTRNETGGTTWNDEDEAELVDVIASTWTGAPFASPQARARARRVIQLLRKRNMLATDRAFE